MSERIRGVFRNAHIQMDVYYYYYFFATPSMMAEAGYQRQLICRAVDVRGSPPPRLLPADRGLSELCSERQILVQLMPSARQRSYREHTREAQLLQRDRAIWRYLFEPIACLWLVGSLAVSTSDTY